MTKNDRQPWSVRYFDALVKLRPWPGKSTVSAGLGLGRKSVPGILKLYHPGSTPDDGGVARITISKPLVLSWKQHFVIEAEGVQGEGRVLFPTEDASLPRNRDKRREWLRLLMGSEKDMITALAEEKGMVGISGGEIIGFSGLNEEEIKRIGRELEAEGRILIVSFSPLFLLAREQFDFLCEKVTDHIAAFHRMHADETGIPFERLVRRFRPHPRVLLLAVRTLIKKGRIKARADRLALSDFQLRLSAEEEKILRELESMYLNGKFRSVTLEEMRKRFRLSERKLNLMTSLLIERKKIVQSNEGFILHSTWLEEIIGQLRASGKRELTVPEFKQMTGLTRKYAIPLLELLDQIGVTRRQGPSREIVS